MFVLKIIKLYSWFSKYLTKPYQTENLLCIFEEKNNNKRWLDYFDGDFVFIFYEMDSL